MAENWCCTDLEIKKYKSSILWTISSFRLIYKNGDFQSSTFVVNNEWEYYLYFSFAGSDMAIYLKSSRPAPLQMDTRISLINRERKYDKIYCQQDKKYFQYTGKICLLNFSEKFLMEENNGFLNNDTLRIFCEVEVTQSDVVNSSGQIPIKQFEASAFALVKDFENRKFCDITFAVEGHELQANKIILAEHSEVFAAMFEHDMKERSLNRIEIEDISHEVLEEMLRFIYTGKVLNLNKLAADLFVAADKYAITQLKSLCEATLCTNLSVETAVASLALANLYNLIELKERSIFLIKTQFAAVSKKMIESNNSSVISVMIEMITDKLHQLNKQ